MSTVYTSAKTISASLIIAFLFLNQQSLAQTRYFSGEPITTPRTAPPNGPFYQPVTDNLPDKAYSPFDQQTDYCPAFGCEYQDNVLLVKLKETETRQSTQQRRNAEKVSSRLQRLSATLEGLPVKSIEPVFQLTDSLNLPQTVQAPNGEIHTVPDLSLWHRIELDPSQLEASSTLLQEKEDQKTKAVRTTVDLRAVMDELSTRSDIAFVEPNYQYKLAADPAPRPLAETPVATDSYSDPLVSQQWHLDAVRAPEAWAYLEEQGLPAGGSSDVVVAVIDTGVDYTHPDLINSMWINPGEFNTSNNSDSDGNGYRDDIHGAVVISGALSGEPLDDHGHGTHVAGIIAAQGNNGIGGVGVAPNVKIMAIKAAQYSGILSGSDVARGIEYAIAHGADVINMSFGGYAKSQIMEDALANAFGVAVLVAAAGNDGRPNLSCPNPPYVNQANMYPASYNWVLGVMARTQNLDSKGGYLAGFSNFDCAAGDLHEYEVMAPGVDIHSPLPFEGYGAWSGTSMAAPVVSAIAALARTRWNNKVDYSSRFIMGQSAATGGVIGYQMADAYTTLTVTPEPDLAYLSHWIFDGEDISEGNVPNGRVDAGETIELAMTIKNHWGKADNVSVTLEARVSGAIQADPYVTMVTDTVNYGAVGSFSEDDNGLTRDESGLVIGADNPFVFSVSPDTPNNHRLVFQVTMTAENAFDSSAQSSMHYASFYVTVQKGQELPSIIDHDITLTSDKLWIVSGPTLILENVIVNVDPGVDIQWGSPTTGGVYTRDEEPYLRVEGSLFFNGDLNDPVNMFPRESSPFEVKFINYGVVDLKYCQVIDPDFGFGRNVIHGADSIEHCRITSRGGRYRTRLFADHISNSFISLKNLHTDSSCGTVPVSPPVLFLAGAVDQSWVDVEGGSTLDCSGFNAEIKDSVYPASNPHSNWKYYTLIGASSLSATDLESAKKIDPSINRNAFLNRTYGSLEDLRLYYYALGGRGNYFSLADNYWDTTSEALVDVIVQDFSDDWNRGTLIYDEIAHTPYESTYPFVTDIDIQVDGTSTEEVGAQPLDIYVSFNRDMDTTVDPMVSFGPAMPYTDYIVQGEWQDARTWKGQYTVTPITGDGYQYFRVIDAVAADDPWLKTGNDYYRFRFEVITTGTEAMNLQASGQEGQIQLWWSQDDFDTLAGYNIYRAPVGSTNFQRINNTIIPQGLTTWSDTSVEPGQPYQYYFTIVKTDLTESNPSNIAQATALDTIAPTLTHTPLVSAAAGLPVTFRAQASDNVAITSVKLFYKLDGESSWSERTMNLVSGQYTTTLEASLIKAPGFSYYIEASDGINITRTALAASPHVVIVDDTPTVTGVSPTSGPVTGGTTITVTGSNFQAGATVRIGQAICSNVNLASSTSLQCTTGPSQPEVSDVRVQNSTGAASTLPRAFTYLSEEASISLPQTNANSGGSLLIPLSIGNVTGLVSAQLHIDYDPSVIEITNASNGNLSSGWVRAVNINNTTGKLVVAMSTDGGSVSGDGSLLQLNLDIVGAPSSQTALTLSQVLLNDGAIPYIIQNGQVTVDGVFDITGTVSYWNGQRPIAGTNIGLSNSQSNAPGHITDSGADGRYTVSLPAGSYTLTPSRSSTDDALSSLDASKVLRHVVALETLTGSAVTAADVNGSGSITAQDAFQILQYVAGLSTLPFNGSSVVWRFSPESRSFDSLSSNQSNQNFTGILLGDTTGNWGTASSPTASTPSLSKADMSLSASARRSELSTELSLHSSTGLPGSRVETGLSLDAVNGGFLSLDFDITYDPTVAEVASVTKSALLDGWSVFINTQTPGVIRIAAAGTDAVTDLGELFALAFNIVGEEAVISDLNVENLRIDEGQVSAQITNGVIRSADPVHIFNDRFSEPTP